MSGAGPSSSPEPPVYADFFDGKSAAVRRVGYRLDEDARSIVLEFPEADNIVWPLDRVRALRDLAGDSRLILTSLDRPLARLVLVGTPSSKFRRLAPDLFKAPAVRGKGRIATWAVGAVASVALIIFVLVPVMADQLARILPPEGEQALGEATLGQIQTALAEDFSDFVPVCDAPAGLDAMEAMRSRLGDDFDLPYDINVTILDHPMVNAFALPGGQVVFFRGMLETATHPDQIAAVLAHEIGHVVARDPTRIALRSAGSLGVLGLLFGDFAGGAVVLLLVEQLIQADYTREAEAAADDFGIDMMVNAGLDPGALGDLFEVMRETYGDAEGIAAHFMSHPSLGDRIEKARDAASRVGAPRPSLNLDDWAALQAVCEP